MQLPASRALRLRHTTQRLHALPPHVQLLAAAVAPVCFTQASITAAITGACNCLFTTHTASHTQLTLHTTTPRTLEQECQANADRSFLLAIAIPMVLAVAGAAYVARPPPQELRDSGQVFEEESTGFLFEVPDDTEPELDKDVSVVCVRRLCWCGWLTGCCKCVCCMLAVWQLLVWHMPNGLPSSHPPTQLPAFAPLSRFITSDCLPTCLPLSLTHSGPAGVQSVELYPPACCNRL